LVADSISTVRLDTKIGEISTLSTSFTAIDHLIVKNFAAANAVLNNTLAFAGTSTISLLTNGAVAPLDISAFPTFNVIVVTDGVTNISLDPENINSNQSAIVYVGVRNQKPGGGNLTIAFSGDFKAATGSFTIQNNRQVALNCVSFGSNLYEVGRSGEIPL
jgi:hypothetical protein